MANLTIQELNDQKAVLLVPAMLYMCVLMVAGVFGNVLVVYVFPVRLGQGTQSTLITCLAVFDLLTCLIAMPTEVADMRYFYLFKSEFACKLLRFVNTFCSMCSILTLLAIAVDRFRKVCRPHGKQLSSHQVKIAVGVTVTIATIFSWPAVILYGIRTADTGIDGLTGQDCSTSDSVQHTLYPLIYNGILGLMFIVMAVVLCVLYFLVWRTAKKHSETTRPTQTGGNRAVATIELSSADSETSGPGKTTYSPSKSPGSRKRINKTTTIAFLVTIVFILSILPHLCLVIVRALIKDFDYSLDKTGTVLFNIFLRSYFVNSAANPIIYGVMNIRFRRECSKVLKRMFCCCRN